MLLCIVLAIMCYCASFMHACREEMVRNRTGSGLVRKIFGMMTEADLLRKSLVMTCIEHYIRYLLYIAAMRYMIHAYSLYLYVVRFDICQMMYLTHSWVNIF